LRRRSRRIERTFIGLNADVQSCFVFHELVMETALLGYLHLTRVTRNAGYEARERFEGLVRLNSRIFLSRQGYDT